MVRRASVTVYLSLTLVVTLSLIFTMLEGLRYRGLALDCNRMARSAADSAFGEYQRELLERYDLFLVDGAYAGEDFDISRLVSRMEYFAYENSAAGRDDGGVDFYALTPCGVTAGGYQLATDDGGAPYYNMACRYMEGSLAVTALKQLINGSGDLAESADGGDMEDKLTEAGEAVSSVGEEGTVMEEEDGSVTEEEKAAVEQVTDEEKGVLDTVGELLNKGILSLVTDEASISDKAIDADDVVSARSLCAGTYEEEDREGGAAGRIVFQAYLGEKFACFAREGDDSALDYEMEYVFAGKDSDVKNLTAVVESLLAIREAVNFAYICTDKEKVSKARVIALAIAGILAVPTLVEAVTLGVLAAWSVVESINDVRTLMDGGKVAPIKTAATWKTSVTGQASSSGGDDKGLTYEQYLQLLLYGRSVKSLTMRSLDLIELNVNCEEYCENVRMDHCVSALEWTAEYEGGPMFLNLLGAVDGSFGEYLFTASGNFKYQ
ncbi:MAG: DUF5702 domain-containing protein [Eubacterium sp.]|nr:DUF5702 domain-containing protein [Eubacterium sp.]